MDEEMELSMEDLSMGLRPKMQEKEAKVTPSTAAILKSIEKIIAGIEGKSINDYKKMAKQDRKALRTNYSELTDACYTAKSLIREACEKEGSKLGYRDEY